MNESTEQQCAYCTPNRMLQCGNGNDTENKGKKMEKYANNKLLSACKSTRNYEITELN